MTIRLIMAFAIAFFVSSGIGAFLVPWLRKIKAGQAIREDGPRWHMSKSGTPTMGGIMFIAALAVVCLTVGFEPMMNGDWGHIFCFVFALIFGAIGFLDDYEKLRKKQNLGLSAKSKFLLQLVAALAFVFLMRRTGYVTTNLYVGTVNSVNLTDGVDGLAAGTSIPVCLFFSVLAYIWGEQYLSLGIYAAALVGGLMGFLIYNYNPAKVFMGDTGSLFLGGAIVALAFAYDMPLILIVLGLMYIIETLSDIIQVGYFKLSHGKRVFKMAPFHHHLEMGGWTGKKWTERELFLLYFSISLVCAVISFVGVYGRYAF